MIENNLEQVRQANRARRKGVVASSQLRSHFIGLARQVKHWADSQSKQETSRGKTIGVTSLTQSAGRSNVSFNLACALASLDRNTSLLIESDFGKHFVTRRLGHSKAPGLSELLLGVAEKRETIFATSSREVSVMGCGGKSDQEALELPFEGLSSLITEQLDDFGWIVFDLPLADQLTACHSILPQLDAVILTVDASQLDPVQIERFRKQVESQGVDIVGVVLNKV